MTSRATHTAPSAERDGRLGAGRIWRAALAMYGRAPLLWMGLAAPAAILGGTRQYTQAQAGEPGTLALLQILGFALAMLALGMTLTLACSAWFGEPVRVDTAFRRVGRRLLPLMGVYLLATVLVMIGLALFVVPGLYLAGMFAMLAPAVVLEGQGLGAFRRSRALTKGYRWPVVGVFGLAVLAAAVVTFLVGFALGVGYAVILPGLSRQAGPIVSGLANGVGQLIVLPGIALVTGACYWRLVALKGAPADAARRDANWPYTDPDDPDADARFEDRA